MTPGLHLPVFTAPPALWPWIVLAIVGLIGSMLFSGMETGLYTVSRLRLQLRSWRQEPAALHIERWLREPTAILAGLLIWQNLCNFAVSAAATVLMHEARFSDQLQAVLSALLLTPFMLMFAEIIPKDMFLTHADQWTYRLVGFLQAALRIITIVPLLPLLLLLNFLTLRLFHGESAAAATTMPEVVIFAEESSATGLISDTQRDLIRRALRMAHVVVGDVMVPWNRVIGIPHTISREGFCALVRRYNVSRLPVLGRSTEDILGVVHVVDALGRKEGFNIQADLQQPLTLFPEQSVRSAITLMQAARQTIAIVVNRRGRPIGLVTMKDLVEELIGELQSW
ncbi:MAG: CNNM domain-containing protein [Planctomycetes bacterium]|jgi:CBS domain containing-hemolysin-like protein|nr:CNNM domain-containing protein [Planctomycetota bacterium]